MSNLEAMAEDLLNEDDIVDLVDDYDLLSDLGDPIKLTDMVMPGTSSKMYIDTVDTQKDHNVRSRRDFENNLLKVSRYVLINNDGEYLELFMRTPKGEFVSIAYGPI